MHISVLPLPEADGTVEGRARVGGVILLPLSPAAMLCTSSSSCTFVSLCMNVTTAFAILSTTSALRNLLLFGGLSKTKTFTFDKTSRPVLLVIAYTFGSHPACGLLGSALYPYGTG